MKIRAPKISRKSLLLVVTLIVIVAGAIKYFWPQPAIIDPFSAKVLASVQFPLYYPTYLPPGYRIETSSVSEPQYGVVVYDAVGPDRKKIYISEEARPPTFDFGGYYKGFSDLHETYGSYGTLTLGRINAGKVEVGSLTNNKTWVLMVTSAQIPLNEIGHTLTTVSLSY